MLGVISQKAPTVLITKTLAELEESLSRPENDIPLLEAIVLCLSRLVPLLDEVCMPHTSVQTITTIG